MKQAMETVWRERAHRLSKRTVPAASSQDAWPVIVVGIGTESYGIDLPDVAEVLPPVHVTPVPGAAALFAGVVNVHGEIRAVIDLRRFLGLQAAQNEEPSRVILLRHGGREVGLQIDRVDEIRWIGAGDLQSAADRDTEKSPRIKGSTKDLLMLLSTGALVAELGLAELDAIDPDKGVTS